MRDVDPDHASMNWQDLTELLTEPIMASCTLQNCLGSRCAYKKELPCWSPAQFTGKRSTANVDFISLLVFDVDQAAEDQFTALRNRLAPFQYLIHSTHSNSFRAVLPLSTPIERPEWTRFFKKAWQNFMPEAELLSLDPARLYLLPSCPQGGNFFSQVNTGKVLETDSLFEPLDVENLLNEPC